MRRLKLLPLLAVLLLAGCTLSPRERTFTAMDTVMTFTVYGEEKTLTDGEDRVRQLEKELSVTDPESAVARINETGRGALGQDGIKLLEKALSLCKRTGGLLDISVYPLVKAWGFTGSEHHVPDADTRASLLPLVNYENITLDGNNVILPHGAMIDLGAVAKGYTGDVLIADLKAAGVTSACLNLGGNVQTLGTKPDGSFWRIGVQDPASSGYLGVLCLQDQAAITSGAYQRYFEENGMTYGHILDPRTGCPADTDLLSVTVIGREGVTCDGLSTALFVMGEEQAVSHWRQYRDFDMVLVKQDGSVAVTRGMADRFSLTDGSRKLTVIEP